MKLVQANFSTYTLRKVMTVIRMRLSQKKKTPAKNELSVIFMTLKVQRIKCW